MIDRIFAAVLTFCVLIGATLVIGAALFGLDQPTHPAPRVKGVQLEPVVITAQRPASGTALATATESAAQRLQ